MTHHGNVCKIEGRKEFVMYKITGTRLQQVGSCSYRKITVKFPRTEFPSAEHIIQYLKDGGYGEVNQHRNGTNTKNLFFHCLSKKKFPIGHKFHEVSITAIDCTEDKP